MRVCCFSGVVESRLCCSTLEQKYDAFSDRCDVPLRLETMRGQSGYTLEYRRLTNKYLCRTRVYRQRIIVYRLVGEKFVWRTLVDCKSVYLYTYVYVLIDALTDVLVDALTDVLVDVLIDVLVDV